MLKHPSKSDCSRKKNQTIDLMELTPGGKCSMWNFRERIRKGVEFTRVIKKKPGV